MRSFKSRSIRKPLAVTAIALGLTAGGYGVASAATGSQASSTSPDAAAAATTNGAPSAATTTGARTAPAGATAQNPWGNQRSDETLLTGATLAKVKAAALDKVGSGSTIVRIETDADGNGAYEAHMLKSDGTPVTVYLDKSFSVVSVDSR
jgi:hypothetical protein